MSEEEKCRRVRRRHFSSLIFYQAKDPNIKVIRMVAHNARMKEKVCPDCKRSYATGRVSAKNREKYAREYLLRKRYGLTIEQFDLLVEEQMGVCPVCLGYLGDDPCIDHDHETGKVRGVLCRKCNLMLGLAGDSLDVFYGAISYLEKNGKSFIAL